MKNAKSFSKTKIFTTFIALVLISSFITNLNAQENKSSYDSPRIKAIKKKIAANQEYYQQQNANRIKLERQEELVLEQTRDEISGKTKIKTGTEHLENEELKNELKTKSETAADESNSNRDISSYSQKSTADYYAKSDILKNDKSDNYSTDNPIVFILSLIVLILIILLLKRGNKDKIQNENK